MDSVSSVGVLDKAIRVLRAVEESGPQTLLELQGATGLPRATSHRIAVALQFNNSLRILAHDNPHLTLAALNAILWASVFVA